MDLLFTKSLWEADPGRPFEDHLARVRNDGFDGTELFLPFFDGDPDETLRRHRALELERVAAIATFGDTPIDHLRDLERQVELALRFEPILINSHTGRDIFAFDANLALFERALELSSRHGVAIVHETHRTRPTYSAIETRRYLEALPELRLNADVSHWMVVHESDLSDQPRNVELLIQRSDHIHARVGYEEGPQVNDPRAPEWRAHLENHLGIWRGIVAAHRARGSARLTITPEFGPDPYVPALPYTRQPLVDVWELNVHIKDLLREALD